MTTDTTDTGSPGAAPPPRVAPPPRRLTRRTDDRLLGGVASGLADFFALDPVLVRIGFVVLGLFGGGGVVLYLALWLLVPEADSGEVLARRAAGWADDPVRQRFGSQRGVAFWIGIALIGLAAIAILDSAFDGGILAALLLIGIGVALFRSDDGRPVPPPPSRGPTGYGPATGGGDAAVGTDVVPSDVVPSDAVPSDAVPSEAVRSSAEDPSWPAGGGMPPPARPVDWVVPPPPPARPRRVRERSILGRLTLGLAVLWVGIAAFLDQSVASVDLTAAGIIGVAMAILGTGLLVGAWVGRARWLLLPALLLLPVLAVASVSDRIAVPFEAGIGDRYRFVPVDEVVVEEELFAGDLTIDLVDGPEALEAFEADRTRRVRAAVGAGQLTVRVPAHWTLAVDAYVRTGEIRVSGVDDVREAGVEQRVRTVLAGEVGAPRAELDLDVTFGEIRIIRQEVVREEVAR